MNPFKTFFSDFQKSNPKEKAFMFLGVIFLAAAIVGVFLPIVPQVPFAIISAFLFSKGNPKIHRWIRHNKHFGPPVKDWEDHHVIRRKLKIISTVAMIAGAIIGHWKLSSPMPLILDGAFFLAIIFVLTRKSKPTGSIQMFQSKKMHWDVRVILITIIATIAVTIVAINLHAPGTTIPHRVAPLYAVDDENFKQIMGSLLGPPMTPGNHIEPLENGDQIFPAMLDAIHQAKKTITFETFIYWSGNIGRQFSEALSERARAGVKVLLILDAVGSRELSKHMIAEMENAGVIILKYRPLHWYTLAKYNNRTHRKLLVVDGTVGFTGGVGIADKWEGNADSEDHWRDCHYKVTGPVVSQLQAAFLDDWNKEKADVPHGPDFFPALSPTGQSFAQVFKSSPEEGSNNVRLMYIASIELARKSIQLATAYFVPDDHVRGLLMRAANRGVKVEIILPGKFTDSKMTRGASREMWEDLLKVGIKIYEFEPTMFHSKYLIVDDAWVSVGSTNFDNRSFQLNAESNLNILDKNFAAIQSATFEKDKMLSKEVTLEEWKHRPLTQKIMDKVFYIFNRQL